jgi:hypothetical protein
MCWIARFSAFGDSASTHRALGLAPYRWCHFLNAYSCHDDAADGGVVLIATVRRRAI